MELLACGREEAPSSLRILFASGVGTLDETDDLLVSNTYASPSNRKQQQTNAASISTILLNAFITSMRKMEGILYTNLVNKNLLCNKRIPAPHQQKHIDVEIVASFMELQVENDH